MSKEVVVSKRVLLNFGLQLFFFTLYCILNVLVFVGEWVQRILVAPWFFFIWAKNPIKNLVIFLSEYIQLSVYNVKKVIAKNSKTATHSITKTTVPLKPIYNYGQAINLFIYSFARRIQSFFVSRHFRFFIYGFMFCLLVMFVYQSYLFVMDLPSPKSIGTLNFAQSTHLYDRNGKLLYEIYRDFNRTPVKLADLPPYILNATISSEDKNFYNHKGISFVGGILRGVKDTLATNTLQGGSTITQQLVKTALLTPDRTIERKVKEIILAIWTEQLYTKNQILEMYLNQVSYGGSAYGIEEASKIYFGKSAKYLNLPEAALLAGLTSAPSLYSPFVDKDLAIERRNFVLDLMYNSGYISKLEHDIAVKTELNIKPVETNIRAPHFVFYTKNFLENEYGSKQVEEGGFRVQTTLDLDIQTTAEQILKEEIEKLKNLDVSNGGMVVIKPDTGEILAMVGSVDYFSDEYGAFNVTTALRQPGSTLKPMLYALALQRGYTAASPIDDTPIIFQVPGGEAYRPVNYDGHYHGRVTLRYALSNSYNIPAVKILNTIGVQPFVDFAKQMGIDSWNDSSRFGLSLSLGGGEITLLDLAQVYGVFATGGYRVEQTPIKNIVDSKERTVRDLREDKTRVLDNGIAFIISDILSDNVARQQAFGPNSLLEIPGHKVSVKTGTTDEKKDNYTVGYTPEFLVAVWVGNNNNRPMNPYLTSGVTGAAPIWNRMMKYLVENKSTGKQFHQPKDVIAKPCYGNGKMEYFLRGTDLPGNCINTIIKPRQAQVVYIRNTN
ncbi:hypothetical protein BH09PAT2_BH09PAT2_05600 [soil metagenome]